MSTFKKYKLGEIVTYINGGVWPVSAYSDERIGIPMPLLVLPQNHMHHSRCSVLSRATKRNDEDYGGDGVRLGLPTFERLATL